MELNKKMKTVLSKGQRTVLNKKMITVLSKKLEAHICRNMKFLSFFRFNFPAYSSDSTSKVLGGADREDCQQSTILRGPV